MTTNKIQVLQALESIRVYSKVSEAVQCRMQEQFDDALATLQSAIFHVSREAIEAFDFIAEDYVEMLSECEMTEAESLKIEKCLKTVAAALKPYVEGKE